MQISENTNMNNQNQYFKHQQWMLIPTTNDGTNNFLIMQNKSKMVVDSAGERNGQEAFIEPHPSSHPCFKGQQ